MNNDINTLRASNMINKRESQEAKSNLAEAINNLSNLEYQKKQELLLAEQEIE